MVQSDRKDPVDCLPKENEVHPVNLEDREIPVMSVHVVMLVHRDVQELLVKLVHLVNPELLVKQVIPVLPEKLEKSALLVLLELMEFLGHLDRMVVLEQLDLPDLKVRKVPLVHVGLMDRMVQLDHQDHLVGSLQMVKMMRFLQSLEV